MPASHLNAGLHVPVDDAELLVGQGGTCGCGATGDPVSAVVERGLTDRLAVRVPNRSAVSVTRVGDWKADRLEACGSDAVEPLRLGNLDVDEVVLFGLIEILDPVRVPAQLV